jgi:hypothetical protein
VHKIVTKNVEIDPIDESGFCKARPRFELLPPFFARLSGKDVGARFAVTLLEVGIQRAPRLIRPLSMVRSLPPFCPTVIHPAFLDICV